MRLKLCDKLYPEAPVNGLRVINSVGPPKSECPRSNFQSSKSPCKGQAEKKETFHFMRTSVRNIPVIDVSAYPFQLCSRRLATILIRRRNFFTIQIVPMRSLQSF